MALSPGPSVFTAFLALSRECRIFLSLSRFIFHPFLSQPRRYPQLVSVKRATYAMPSVLFSLRFFPLASSGRSLADSPARSYRHFIASASLFSTLSPRHISAFAAASPSVLVVCVAAFSPLSASLRFSTVIPPSSPSVVRRRVHEKRNGEKRAWLEMESLATHPRLIPLFSPESHRLRGVVNLPWRAWCSQASTAGLSSSFNE